MPIVNIDLEWLNRLLGKEFPPEVISESLEQIGCDVEELAEVSRSRCPVCEDLVEHPVGQQEVKACTVCGHQSEVPFALVGTTSVVRLDLLAARPDLFDVGGLARALRGTLGIVSGLPDYPVQPSGLTVHVDPLVADPDSYRPYIHCAVMNLPEVDDTGLVAIMKLQENLHWGVGRDRKLASIGVYDMDSLQGDIQYRTLHPDDEPFVPLGMPGHPMSGRQILQEHPKGMAYAHLLAEHHRYPVLLDSRGQVLSMPPIINSEETRLKRGTRRVFIDVTGISDAAARKALNTLVCSLAELGGAIESVVIRQGQQQRLSPDLTPGRREVDLAEAKRWLGLPLDGESLMGTMRKMRLDAQPVAGNNGRFEVRYPAYRTDIRHMVDLFEDVAIGYGYSNIEGRLVPSLTVGQGRPEAEVSARVRQTLLGLGYTEIMSLPMTSEEHHFERLGLPIQERYPKVSNPKLKAYNVLRTHLMTGLLECLYENRRRPLPLMLFELDNVCNLEEGAETGVREERRSAFVEMGREAGFASIRTALDALLHELGKKGRFKAIEHPSFVPGRAASFEAGEGIQGILGEIHPQVLSNFGLTHPVALAEISLQRIF